MTELFYFDVVPGQEYLSLRTVSRFGGLTSITELPKDIRTEVYEEDGQLYLLYPIDKYTHVTPEKVTTTDGTFTYENLN